jgi:hypothetical protein
MLYSSSHEPALLPYASAPAGDDQHGNKLVLENGSNQKSQIEVGETEADGHAMVRGEQARGGVRHGCWVKASPAAVEARSWAAQRRKHGAGTVRTARQRQTRGRWIRLISGLSYNANDKVTNRARVGAKFVGFF